MKQDNLVQLQQNPITAHRLVFYRGDIRDLDALHQLFQAEPIDLIIHLAARAGVRPSIEQTLLYGDINVQGTLNLLECCRHYHVQDFVFGSSSSVYGERRQGPFAETDDVSMPVSPYAATKRAGELFCHTYSHLYAMRIACLRFFTVYGPGQRPDLAIHKFARLMSQGQALPVYGDGSSQRDYTYVDDIVDGIVRAWHWLQQSASDRGVYEIFNLGGSHPVPLRDLIQLLEAALGYQAHLDWQPMQPGDVECALPLPPLVIRGRVALIPKDPPLAAHPRSIKHRLEYHGLGIRALKTHEKASVSSRWFPTRAHALDC
jgi:UDP-glucuronate 4-epimerase